MPPAAPAAPGGMSELPVMLVAVGVGVKFPGRALGVAVGGIELSAVTVGEGSCPTMDAGLASGVLVGRAVADGKVVGVDVGTVVGVGDGVAVGSRVGVAVGTRVGVKVGVAVGDLVAVEVLVAVGVGFGSGPKTLFPSESTTSSQ